MYELIPSTSVPNEWVMRVDVSQRFNIPWNLELEFGLREIIIPSVEDKMHGYVPCPQNQYILSTLMPKFESNPRKMSDYRLLFAFQKTNNKGETVMKGAVQHRFTGKIALLTAINIEPKEKHSPSHTAGWYVFRTYMIAPICFWEAFKVC